ncbi:hypothetical protein Bbelb_141730 [Branchiostoma belcheri]|nr:hypothetical protein Bbelb_141730 [Branchiostoma belcheri]
MSGNDTEMHTRNPNPMYTRNNMNPYPMDAQNDVNPNPMYLQSTIEPNVRSGPIMDPTPMYTRNTLNPYPMDAQNDVNPNPMYLQSTIEPNVSSGPIMDPNPMYTRNTLNPYPMDAQNDVNPNPMYLQSTIEPNVSSGPIMDPNPMYTRNTLNPYPMDAQNDVNPNPMYLQSTIEPNVSSGPIMDPNPMYTRNTLNPCPMDAQNDVNPNPMYLQPPVEPPNATTRSDENEDIPCTQAPAGAHQQGDEVNFSPDDNHCQQDDEASSIKTTEYNDDSPCVQPYTVAYMCQDDTVCNTASRDVHTRPSLQQLQPTAASNNIVDAHQQGDEAVFSPANNDDHHCLQPHAVTHQQDVEAAATTSITSDDEDIQPYAAAYMCQGDMPCNTASGDTPTELSSQNQPAAASNNQDDNLGLPANNDALNALNPNPMYVPNVQRRSACAESGDRTLEKTTFPGKGVLDLGVAVSADYEIFVTDFIGKKVHVFSMIGTYRRTFPTVLPGEDSTVDVQPSGVAIGVEPAYLWVVGQRNGNAYNGYIDVVQYSRNGEPTKAFEVPVVEPCFHAAIAVDVCNNKILVGHRDTVMMFHTNGSVYRSFKARERVMIGGITSDSQGNILLVLKNAQTVMVYSYSGDKVFEFGSTVRRGTCGLGEFSGICLDTLGRIIVANHKDGRIDMFTSRGKFVRTLANITFPWGIAMGPGGELVVSTPFAITVFPRQALLP